MATSTTIASVAKQSMVICCIEYIIVAAELFNDHLVGLRRFFDCTRAADFRSKATETDFIKSETIDLVWTATEECKVPE